MEVPPSSKGRPKKRRASNGGKFRLLGADAVFTMAQSTMVAAAAGVGHSTPIAQASIKLRRIMAHHSKQKRDGELKKAELAAKVRELRAEFFELETELEITRARAGQTAASHPVVTHNHQHVSPAKRDSDAFAFSPVPAPPLPSVASQAVGFSMNTPVSAFLQAVKYGQDEMAKYQNQLNLLNLDIEQLARQMSVAQIEEKEVKRLRQTMTAMESDPEMAALLLEVNTLQGKIDSADDVAADMTIVLRDLDVALAEKQSSLGLLTTTLAAAEQRRQRRFSTSSTGSNYASGYSGSSLGGSFISSGSGLIGSTSAFARQQSLLRRLSVDGAMSSSNCTTPGNMPLSGSASPLMIDYPGNAVIGQFPYRPQYPPLVASLSPTPHTAPGYASVMSAINILQNGAAVVTNSLFGGRDDGVEADEVEERAPAAPWARAASSLSLMVAPGRNSGGGSGSRQGTAHDTKEPELYISNRDDASVDSRDFADFDDADGGDEGARLCDLAPAVATAFFSRPAPVANNSRPQSAPPSSRTQAPSLASALERAAAALMMPAAAAQVHRGPMSQQPTVGFIEPDDRHLNDAADEEEEVNADEGGIEEGAADDEAEPQGSARAMFSLLLAMSSQQPGSDAESQQERNGKARHTHAAKGRSTGLTRPQVNGQPQQPRAEQGDEEFFGGWDGDDANQRQGYSGNVTFAEVGGYYDGEEEEDRQLDPVTTAVALITGQSARTGKWGSFHSLRAQLHASGQASSEQDSSDGGAVQDLAIGRLRIRSAGVRRKPRRGSLVRSPGNLSNSTAARRGSLLAADSESQQAEPPVFSGDVQGAAVAEKSIVSGASGGASKANASRGLYPLGVAELGPHTQPGRRRKNLPAPNPQYDFNGESKEEGGWASHSATGELDERTYNLSPGHPLRSFAANMAQVRAPKEAMKLRDGKAGTSGQRPKSASYAEGGVGGSRASSPASRQQPRLVYSREGDNDWNDRAFDRVAAAAVAALASDHLVSPPTTPPASPPGSSQQHRYPRAGTANGWAVANGGAATPNHLPATGVSLADWAHSVAGAAEGHHPDNGGDGSVDAFLMELSSIPSRLHSRGATATGTAGVEPGAFENAVLQAGSRPLTREVAPRGEGYFDPDMPSHNPFSNRLVLPGKSSKFPGTSVYQVPRSADAFAVDERSRANSPNTSAPASRRQSIASNVIAVVGDDGRSPATPNTWLSSISSLTAGQAIQVQAQERFEHGLDIQSAGIALPALPRTPQDGGSRQRGMSALGNSSNAYEHSGTHLPDAALSSSITRPKSMGMAEIGLDLPAASVTMEAQLPRKRSTSGRLVAKLRQQAASAPTSPVVDGQENGQSPGADDICQAKSDAEALKGVVASAASSVPPPPSYVPSPPKRAAPAFSLSIVAVPVSPVLAVSASIGTVQSATFSKYKPPPFPSLPPSPEKGGWGHSAIKDGAPADYEEDVDDIRDEEEERELQQLEAAVDAALAPNDRIQSLLAKPPRRRSPSPPRRGSPDMGVDLYGEESIAVSPSGAALLPVSSVVMGQTDAGGSLGQWTPRGHSKAPNTLPGTATAASRVPGMQNGYRQPQMGGVGRGFTVAAALARPSTGKKRPGNASMGGLAPEVVRGAHGRGVGGHIEHRDDFEEAINNSQWAAGASGSGIGSAQSRASSAALLQAAAGAPLRVASAGQAALSLSRPPSALPPPSAGFGLGGLSSRGISSGGGGGHRGGFGTPPSSAGSVALARRAQQQLQPLDDLTVFGGPAAAPATSAHTHERENFASGSNSQKEGYLFGSSSVLSIEGQLHGQLGGGLPTEGQEGSLVFASASLMEEASLLSQA